MFDHIVPCCIATRVTSLAREGIAVTMPTWVDAFAARVGVERHGAGWGDRALPRRADHRNRGLAPREHGRATAAQRTMRRSTRPFARTAA